MGPAPVVPGKQVRPLILRLPIITTPCVAFRGSSACEPVVSRCEWFPSSRGERRQEKSPPRFAQGVDWFSCFFVLNCVVSSVVILLRFPVDLRGLSHNTDAQNIA